MSNRQKGFTLAEIMVVLGIVVIFVALAIPTIRTMMGTTSIDMTQNNVSALLARAREDAVAIQDVRGVLFYVDKSNDRVIGIAVGPAAIQDPSLNILMLDATPNRDSMALPPGVRLQTIFNGLNPTTASQGNGDRYLGFNLVRGTQPTPTSPGVWVGGVILFDANGRCVSRAYGIQMTQPNPKGLPIASNICNLFRIDYTQVSSYVDAKNLSVGSYCFIPGYINGAAPTSPSGTVLSQLGMVLFDYEQFKSHGFTDQDADIQGTGYAAAWPIAFGTDGDSVHTEQNEEAWLDNYATALMVNRFDGTLISAK